MLECSSVHTTDKARIKPVALRPPATRSQLAVNIRTLENSLQQWDRMIDWVKRQPASERRDRCKMLSEIGENWLSQFSPLCLQYNKDCKSSIEARCPYLEVLGHKCVGLEEWRLLIQSKCWSDWLESASKIVEIERAILTVLCRRLDKTVKKCYNPKSHLKGAI